MPEVAVREVGERPRTFFPSQVNTYRQCPERYFLQYIAKRNRPHPFSAALVKGGATHRLIAKYAARYLNQGSLPGDLLEQARSEVSTTIYPESERAHIEDDARDVAEWTVTALEMLPEDARPLLVERRLYAPIGRGPVQLGAQVDLVIERDDATVEHIDFKTGKRRDDRLQMLISRIVVGRRMRAAPRIRTTALYIQQRQADSHEMHADDYRSEWRELRETIRAIRSTNDWPPTPGPLCDYCPYKARDCTAWRGPLALAWAASA